MSNPHDADPEFLPTFLDQIEDCVDLLERVVEDRGLLAHIDAELRQRLLIASGRISRPNKNDRRRLARVHRRIDKVDTVWMIGASPRWVQGIEDSQIVEIGASQPPACTSCGSQRRQPTVVRLATQDRQQLSEDRIAKQQRTHPEMARQELPILGWTGSDPETLHP